MIGPDTAIQYARMFHAMEMAGEDWTLDTELEARFEALVEYVDVCEPEAYETRHDLISGVWPNFNY